MIGPGQDAGAGAAFRDMVKAYMRANAVTQRQLAEALGFTEKHVSQVLRGNIRMTLVLADVIAEALGLELKLQLGPAPAAAPDGDCVFIDVSGSRVTLTQTTGRLLHVAVNGQWAPLPDRVRVSRTVEHAGA